MSPFHTSDLPENLDLAHMLSRRGFSRETVPALLLQPLVHVAWADGTIDPAEATAITELASRSGLVPNEACAELLRRWLTERPDPSETEANLELLSLLFASVEEELPLSVGDELELAEAIGKASGGVFGLLFRISGAERRALAEIRRKLSIGYDDSWKATLRALRDDWTITDWIEFAEPTETSAVDARDPLLFTASGALDLYDRGALSGQDGRPLGRADLVADLEIEVMRRGPWKRADLQFRLLLDRWLELGLIEDAGVFWNSSPHATVYRALANLRFGIAGRTNRIRKSEQFAFMCQMDQETLGLDGPFLAGEFTARGDATLCGDMSRAMLGMGGGGGMGDTGRWSGDGAALLPDEAESIVIPPPVLDVRDLEVTEADRVAYLVLDRSGSMAGERIRMAKRAVIGFLQRIPPGAGVRVIVRPFDTEPSRTLLPVAAPFTAGARTAMIRRLTGMNTGGTTALFRSVALALDDVLRLADPVRRTVPKIYLIVLSDGEDNQKLVGYRYGSHVGEEALFDRMKDYRDAGVVDYLPIAYGGREAVRGLERIGGAGFKVEVTSPDEIVARFGEIREELMVGIPMSGMAMRARGGAVGSL